MESGNGNAMQDGDQQESAKYEDSECPTPTVAADMDTVLFRYHWTVRVSRRLVGKNEYAILNVSPAFCTAFNGVQFTWTLRLSDDAVLGMLELHDFDDDADERPEKAVRVSLYYKDGPVQDVTLSTGKISITDSSGLRILSDLPLEGTSYTKGSGWSQCLYAESGKIDKFSEYIRNNVGAQITVVAELSIARTWFQPMKYLPVTSGVSKEVEETCQQVLSEILHDELVLPNVEKLLAMENKYEVHKHIFDFALNQVSKRCDLAIQLDNDLIERVVSNVYFDSVLNETATCFEDYLEILQWLGHDFRYLKVACERFICREVLMESADTAFVKKMLLLAERYSLSVLKMVSFGVLVDRLTSPLNRRRESIPEIRSDLLQMADHVTSSIVNNDAVPGNSEEGEILVGAVVEQLEQLVKHIRKVSMEKDDGAIGPAPIPIIPHANRRSSLKTSRDLLQFSSQLTSASERSSTDDDEDVSPMGAQGRRSSLAFALPATLYEV